ncbi:MAG: lysylphosphatidylglycerol synthase transmembrane domain-containing protein [Kiritimatiellae bacterium]|nr:lysylphosphatidylglycerol synthase transmembrane domain-containing protein [Kiritimatiellia bacterium]
MRQRLLFLVKLLVSAGLLYLLYRRVDARALAEQLRTARGGWLAFFFVLLAANTLISSIKWRLLLAADGIRQPLWRLCASHLTGSFFNLFLPSTIGGDVYRVADIGRHSARTVNTAASIMADRLTGFLALSVYGLVFPFVARRHIPNWDARFLLLPALALGGLMAVAAVLWEQRLLRRLAGLLPARLRAPTMRVLDAFLASIRAYTRVPGVWAASIVIAFVFQFVAILAVYSLGRALGLGLHLLPFCFFVPFITLMEMIPISIFGIGLRDTGYVWFMLSVGRTRADAAALSLLYVAATLVYVALGGVIFVFRRSSPHRATTAADE